MGGDSTASVEKGDTFPKLNAQRVLFFNYLFQSLKIFVVCFSYGEFEKGGQ